MRRSLCVMAAMCALVAVVASAAPPPMDATTRAALKARIDALRARVAGGEDFAAVAGDASDDTVTRGQGGDLGWFVHEAFGPQFGDQVAALQDGEVSAPFRTQAGWHIVQRTGTRQTDVGAENRRNQMRETIGQRKLEDEWMRFLREMRGEAYVDIRRADGSSESAPVATPAPAPAN